MNGTEVIAVVEKILKERGISKAEFCAAIGVSSATYSHWAKGSVPKPERLREIEKYLEIDLSDIEKSDPREGLREDHKMLLKSVDGLPQSSVYEIIAEIHKRREAGWGDPTY